MAPTSIKTRITIKIVPSDMAAFLLGVKIVSKRRGKILGIAPHVRFWCMSPKIPTRIKYTATK